MPLRWWVQATMFVAAVWLAFVVALPGVVAWVATGVMAGSVAALFLGYGRARLLVTSEVFQAGRARIPVRLLGQPVALDAADSHRLAGRDANGRAYHLLRPYLKRAVRVSVVDPADPVPYWLVSTRHPEELAAALEAVRAAADDVAD